MVREVVVHAGVQMLLVYGFHFVLLQMLPNGAVEGKGIINFSKHIYT